MPAMVEIEWFKIPVHHEDTCAVTANLLEEEGVDMGRLGRAVYVIRAASSFAIKYPRGHSPTLYIGEGGFKQRITSHRKWLETLYDMVGDFPLEVAVCYPRLNGNRVAYKELEAHLLNEFLKRHYSLPLRNRQNETVRFGHQYDRAAINQVLGVGRGKRFKWAIEPLPSNKFFADYVRTHAEG